jgi:hypothetical protein
MGVGQVIFVAALAIFSYGIYVTITKEKPKYQLDENGYFGKGASKPDDTSIKPFKIEVSDEELKVEFLMAFLAVFIGFKRAFEECSNRTRATRRRSRF